MEVTLDDYQEPDELPDLNISFEEISDVISEFFGTTSYQNLKLLERVSEMNPDFSKLIICMFTLANNGELDDDLTSKFEKVYRDMLVINMNWRDAKIVGSAFTAFSIILFFLLSLDPDYSMAQKAQIVMSIMSVFLAMCYRYRDRRSPARKGYIHAEALLTANAFSKLNAKRILMREEELEKLTGDSLKSLIEEVENLTPKDAADRLGNNLDIIHGEM
jgi:hypothetical protein